MQISQISETTILFLAFLFSFLGSFFSMPIFIKYILEKFSLYQPIYNLAPESHKSKKNTPSLGGVPIYIVSLFIIFFFSNFTSKFMLIAISSITIAFLIGLSDDMKKILKKKNDFGLSAKMKLMLQMINAIISFYFLNKLNAGVSPELENSISIFGSKLINLDYLYFIFVILVNLGTINAVNLTDGLDGLVSFPIITSLIFYLIICLFPSILPYKLYFHKEIAILIIIFLGSILGFLWHNSSPAKIFMGDSGSFTFGQVISIIAIATKQEFMLLIIGIMFVISAISVIIQVIYFKRTKGKRFFLMAPYHHHLEKKSIPENKIVINYFIISLISLATGIYVICGG